MNMTTERRSALLSKLTCDSNFPTYNNLGLAAKFLNLLEILVTQFEEEKKSIYKNSYFFNMINFDAHPKPDSNQSLTIEDLINLMIWEENREPQSYYLMNSASADCIDQAYQTFKTILQHQEKPLYAIIETTGSVKGYTCITTVNEQHDKKVFSYVDYELHDTGDLSCAFDDILLSLPEATQGVSPMLYKFETPADMLTALNNFLNATAPSPVVAEMPQF